MKTLLKLIFLVCLSLLIFLPAPGLAKVSNYSLYGASSCTFDSAGKMFANVNLFGRYTKKGLRVTKINYSFSSGKKNNIMIGTEKNREKYLSSTPDLKGKEGQYKPKPFFLPKKNKGNKIKVFFVLDRFFKDPVCPGTLYLF